MPLYKEWSPNAHSLAAIWHMEEKEAFFLEAVSVREGVSMDHIRHPRRRVEHLAGRYLLQHLKEDFPLHHIAPDQHDKPRLPANQYFFSISHSYPYVAAVISDQEECGIDIQVWREGMEKIVHMFLSPAERSLCDADARLLTLAWSVKEAAYKWYGRRGADFIRDLPINSLLEESTAFYPPPIPTPIRVAIDCFGISLSPEALLYKDFALACIIMERQ